MKNLFIILISLSMQLIAIASPKPSFYDQTDSFLKSYVKAGLVDYEGISLNPNQLNSLINTISSAKVNMSKKNEVQAFYINAYNLYVIKGIVDGRLNSPLDKNGFFDKIKVKVAGEKLTLNDIENKKLRGQYKDPRFHFVLVCGALGCPPLIAKAYRPEILDQQLEIQTVKAINNNQFIKVKKNKVAISQIFEWYNKDFTTNGSTILKFITKYRKEALPENAKLSYYAYNWKVNKQ